MTDRSYSVPAERFHLPEFAVNMYQRIALYDFRQERRSIVEAAFSNPIVSASISWHELLKSILARTAC